MYCKAAQRILLHKYCFLKQFPFDLRLINAFLESDVSNFPSQISKISAHILVFFFYSSIVESTITIVDFFKTPIVEIYSSIVEKKPMFAIERSTKENYNARIFRIQEIRQRKSACQFRLSGYRSCQNF